MIGWIRPEGWPPHWMWIDLPENDGDQRLLSCVNALLDLKHPVAPHSPKQNVVQDPIFGTSNPNDLPEYLADPMLGDEFSLISLVRVAKTVLAIADSARGSK